MKIQRIWRRSLVSSQAARSWIVGGMVLTLIALLLAMPVLASTAPGYHLSRYVIAGSSGSLQSPAYHLQGTLGQAPVGRSGNAAYQLCSGFRCSAAALSRLYLPFTMK